MIRWTALFLVAVLVTVACGKNARDGKWPPITRADLACKSDADCTTRGHECCGGCGGSIGHAMNAERAAKDDHARSSICRDVKCPDLNCEAPTCWDEGEAFCDRGACSLRIVKRGSCAPDDDTMFERRAPDSGLENWSTTAQQLGLAF